MAPAVLVVDDEPDLCASLADYLALHLPVQIEHASSGAEALAKGRASAFDVVLTDYLMPGMDGLELLEEWSRLQPDSRQILLTAYPDADVAHRAWSSGALVIGKPAHPHQIVAAVAQALHLHGAHGTGVMA